MGHSTGAGAGRVQPPIMEPGDLQSADYRLALRRMVKAFIEDDVPGLAAGVAFKIFLALFPSLLAALAIYGLFRTPAEISEGIRTLATILPSEARRLVQDNLEALVELQRETVRSLAVFGVVAGVVSATGAAATLIKALNRAYDLVDERGFLARRLIGLALTGALVAALLSLILLIVAGPPLQRWLLPDQLEIPLVEVPLAVGRFALALAVLTVLFAFVYWIGPNRKRPRWEWLSPGAMVGLGGWVAVAAAFRLYTATIGRDSYSAGSVYGTIGGVIVLLLWLQMSMLATLTGAELNAELERVRTERYLSRARALGPEAVSDELPEAAVAPANVKEATRRAMAAASSLEPIPALPELTASAGAGSNTPARRSGRWPWQRRSPRRDLD